MVIKDYLENPLLKCFEHLCQNTDKTLNDTLLDIHRLMKMRYQPKEVLLSFNSTETQI